MWSRQNEHLQKKKKNYKPFYSPYFSFEPNLLLNFNMSMAIPPLTKDARTKLQVMVPMDRDQLFDSQS